MKPQGKKLTIGLILIIILVFITSAIGMTALASPITFYKLIGSIILILFIAIGFGLIYFKNWARILLMVTYALSIVWDAIALFSGGQAPIELMANIIRIVIALIVIAYLNKTNIKDLFRSPL